jgi:hypothetical protein
VSGGVVSHFPKDVGRLVCSCATVHLVLVKRVDTSVLKRELAGEKIVLIDVSRYVESVGTYRFVREVIETGAGDGEVIDIPTLQRIVILGDRDADGGVEEKRAEPEYS